MSNQHSERRQYLSNYPPVTSEHHNSTTMLGGPHRHSSHRQYIEQLHPQMQHPYTSSPQPYPPSYPLDRISAVSVSPSPQYGHTTPPTTSSGTGSGYLDPFSSMPLPDVMSMDMDPLGGMDLSILDAQEHRDMRVLEDRARRSQETLGSSDMLESGNGRGKGRRTRAQSDDTSETDPSTPARGGRGGNRKQRGRPRLDTKDENAQDRRRTQIRLAQRAYRLRKETTISSLRNRVSELETAIEGMQSTFLELHDSAMNCMQSTKDRGIYGPGLREITERFLSLAKGALGSSEGGDTGAEDDGTDEISNKAQGEENKRRRSRDSDHDGSANGGMPTHSSGISTTWGGYQVSYDRATSQGGSDYHYSDNRESRDAAPKDSMETSRTGIPQDLYSDNSNYTYTYHETTFSRRLHRAALERAYQLLTCPTADQNEVARTFAYTFCYATRENIVRDIATALRSDKGGEPTEFPELAPNPVYDDSDREDGSTDKNSQLKAEAYKQMMKLGINQKYLRPDDVEKILVERGILTTTSTSGMVSLDEDAVPGHASPSSTSSASEVAEARTPEELALSPTFRNTTDEMLLFGVTHTDPAYVDEMDKKDSMKVMQGVKSYLDLDVLIKELLRRGVCLGRYPGFQRPDVDTAIAVASSQQSY